MKSEQDLKDKIDDLESEKDDLENEFKETLEDEDIDENSDKADEIRLEYDQKIEVIEKQIDLLEWVLGE